MKAARGKAKMPKKVYKPTKHQMVINILTARYKSKIRLAPDGKPAGAGARKEYNKYMTQSVKMLEKQNALAIRIIGRW